MSHCQAVAVALVLVAAGVRAESQIGTAAPAFGAEKIARLEGRLQPNPPPAVEKAAPPEKKKKKGGNRCDADFGAQVPSAVRHRWEDEPRLEGGAPLGDRVVKAKKIRHVVPIYPMDALKERIQGTVRLEAIVDESGSVTDVCVSKGHWFFEQSAMNAVRQWRFTPTLLDGKPVPLVMAVEVDYFIR